MKNLIPIILFAVVSEVCSTGGGAGQRNLGGKKQCLEGPAKSIFLAKDDQSFANRAACDDKANWLSEIAAKKLVPLPYIEGIEANNTETARKEGRFTDYTLKDGTRGSTYRFDLSVCTYDALKTYVNSGYTRVYRITTLGEVSYELQDDGSIKGESLTSFLLGIREEAKDDDVPYTNISLKYEQDNFSIMKPPFDLNPTEGIFDVTFTQVSASATEIKFKASADCTGDQITSFLTANVELLDASGSAHTHTFVAADSEGIYTLTGTGFADDFTVGLIDVVTQANIMYETPTPMVVDVT